jgi:SMC proteins Flexible Hinge Domain
LAFFLKGVAVFGGLAFAAGLKGPIAHVVGIAIAVAIAIDALLFNHVRLVVVTKADQAYKNLLKDTKNKHVIGLSPILKLKETGQTAKAQDQASEFLLSLKKELDKKSGEIEKALDAINIKSLESLALQKK